MPVDMKKENADLKLIIYLFHMQVDPLMLQTDEYDLCNTGSSGSKRKCHKSIFSLNFIFKSDIQ